MRPIILRLLSIALVVVMLVSGFTFAVPHSSAVAFSTGPATDWITQSNKSGTDVRVSIQISQPFTTCLTMGVSEVSEMQWFAVSMEIS